MEKFKPKKIDQKAAGAAERIKSFKKSEKERVDGYTKASGKSSSVSNEIDLLNLELEKAKNKAEREKIYIQLNKLVEEKKKLNKELKKEKKAVSQSEKEELSAEDLRDRYKEIYQEGADNVHFQGHDEKNKEMNAAEYFAGQVGDGAFEYRKTPDTKADTKVLDERSKKINAEMKELKKRAKELEAKGSYPADAEPGKPDDKPAGGAAATSVEMGAAAAVAAAATSSEKEPVAGSGEEEALLAGGGWSNRHPERVAGVTGPRRDNIIDLKEISPGKWEKEDMDRIHLEALVENARRDFAKKDYDTNNTWQKLRRFLKIKGTEPDNLKDSWEHTKYKSALNELLKYRLDSFKKQNLPPEELKKEMGDLAKYFNLDEKIELYAARTDARKNAMEGSRLEKITSITSKLINKYRNADWKYKIAFSALLFAGGVTAGAFGAAGAIAAIGTIGTGNRILSGAAAGVGTTGLLESLRRRKEGKVADKKGKEMLNDFNADDLQISAEQLETKFESFRQKLEGEINTFHDSLKSEQKSALKRRAAGAGVALFIGSGAAASLTRYGLGKAAGIFGYNIGAPSNVPDVNKATGTENSMKLPKGGYGTNGPTYTENTHHSGFGKEPQPELGKAYTENSMKMNKGHYGAMGGSENANKLDMNKDFSKVPRVFSAVEVAGRGNNSVWKMIDHQLGARYGNSYSALSPEQKANVIDTFKNQVAKDPKAFGLKNIDTLKAGQKVDFSKLFENGQQVKGIFNHAEHLRPDQIENIKANNKSILNWLKAHPGERLTTPKVADILEHRSGAAHHPAGGRTVPNPVHVVEQLQGKGPSSVAENAHWARSSNVAENLIQKGSDAVVVKKNMLLSAVITEHLKAQGMAPDYAADRAQMLAAEFARTHGSSAGANMMVPMGEQVKFYSGNSGMVESIQRVMHVEKGVGEKILEEGTKIIDEGGKMIEQGAHNFRSALHGVGKLTDMGVEYTKNNIIGPEYVGKINEIAEDKAVKGAAVIAGVAYIVHPKLKWLRNYKKKEKIASKVFGEFDQEFQSIRQLDDQLNEISWKSNPEKSEMDKIKSQREKAFLDLFGKLSRHLYSQDASIKKKEDLKKYNAQNYLLTSGSVNRRFYDTYNVIRKVIGKEATPTSRETLADWNARVMSRFMEVKTLALSKKMENMDKAA